MKRPALVSALLLVTMTTMAVAQQPSPEGNRSFGEKLEGFRQALIGDPLFRPAPSKESQVDELDQAPTLAPPTRAGSPTAVQQQPARQVQHSHHPGGRTATLSNAPLGRTSAPSRTTAMEPPRVATPRVNTPPVEATREQTLAQPSTAAPTRTATVSDLGSPALRSSTPTNNLRQPETKQPLVSKRESEPLRSDISTDSSSRVQRSAPSQPLVNPLHDSPQNTTNNENHVLVARRSPILSVEATGPRTITVGKEALYKVQVRNTAEAPANEVTVQIAIPEFAEVVEARATNGSTNTPQDGSAGLEWKLNNLPGQGRDELTLKIIPRRSEAFDLGLRYSYAPALTTATVQVQEPRLEMHVSGPKDVVYGQQHVYRLTVTNPGSGAAENVVVSLIPISPGDGQVAQHRLGTLDAGGSRTLEIELTARQAGQITIRTEAAADGGLKASAAEQVWVRRAALDVAVSGPQSNYAGVPATYEIRVRNPGDAPAEKVNVAAMLPGDAEFISATSGAQREENSRQVNWNIDRLSPGGEQVFTVKCSMRSGGENRVEATATASNDLRVSKIATTQVTAVADLVLQVDDASGPVPVGQETTYEVRVRNRGTSSADGVEMVLFFSSGVEPVSVEGGLHEISPGTVLFRGIPSLAAGSEVTYKVRAKASVPGSHRVRVELQCRTLGTKLTQEDSTLYYGDHPIANTATAPTTAPDTNGQRYR